MPAKAIEKNTQLKSYKKTKETISKAVHKTKTASIKSTLLKLCKKKKKEKQYKKERANKDIQKKRKEKTNKAIQI